MARSDSSFAASCNNGIYLSRSSVEIRVVGAWTWDGYYGFGIATELDYTEAYAPLRQTQWVVILFALFAAGLIVLLVLLFLRGQRKLEATNYLY